MTQQVQLLVEDVRRQGPADHRRRPGLRRRHQRLLGGAQHRPAAVHGERRHRGDGVHRLDLRRRRRRRGGQLRSARQAAAALGADQGYKAWVDVMLADDPEAPTTITQDASSTAPLTGGPVTGSVILDAGSIQSIDPRIPPAQAALAPARRRASNFLVDGAVALGVGQLARGDGTAARLLLPGDRAADRSPRPRHQRAGRRRARASPCTS